MEKKRPDRAHRSADSDAHAAAYAPPEDHSVFKKKLIELLKTRLTQEFPLDHILECTELKVSEVIDALEALAAVKGAKTKAELIERLRVGN